MMKEFYRGELRQHFGFDPRQQSNAKVCQDVYHIFKEYIGLYTLWANVYLSCLKAAQKAKDSEMGLICTLKEIVNAMRESMFEFLPEIIGREIDSPIDSIREEATFNLSGWLGTQIRMYPSMRGSLERKREALGKDEHNLSEFEFFAQELPGLTLEAWGSDWIKPKDIVNKVGSLIRKKDPAIRPEKEVVSTDLLSDSLRYAKDDHPLSNPAAQVEVADLLAKEEAYFEEKYEEAGLTEYEKAIARLQLLSKYTDQEIADLLNRSPSSVKQSWATARKKLGNVINQ